jgi:hypothetical protein
VANLTVSGDVPAAVYLMPILDLVLFLPLFSVLVPLVYADHHRVRNSTPIALWRVAIVAAVFVSIFVAVLVLSERDIWLLIFVGPTVLLAEVGVLLLAVIANRELTRVDRGAGAA